MTPQRPGPCVYCDGDPNEVFRPHCVGFVGVGALPHLLYGHCDVLRAMWDAAQAASAAERDGLRASLNAAQAMITRLELELEAIDAEGAAL